MSRALDLTAYVMELLPPLPSSLKMDGELALASQETG